MKDYIVEAIAVAKQAVKADQCNPIQAYSTYRECAARYKHIIPHVPDEHKIVFSKFAKAYEERAETLRERLTQHIKAHHEQEGIDGIEMTEEAKVISDARIQGKFVSPYELEELTGDKINQLQGNPFHQIEQPTKWLKKPFWLMRKLNQSMKLGCHLSETLYIPKQVWQIPNATQLIPNMSAKILFIENLLKTLSPLDIIENRSLQEQETLDMLAEALQKFNEEFKEHQSALEKTIQAKSKKSFKLTRMFISKKSENENTLVLTGAAYTTTLMQLFKRCQVLSRWLDHFESTPNQEINEQLQQIAIFLCMQVCQFVLQDLNILLQHYVRIVKESFVQP